MDEPKARKGRQRPAAPTTPDPVEIAMEIAASGQTPADAAMAVLHANAALMARQSLLIDEQIDVAREEANLSREQIALSRDQAGLTRKQLVLANNQIFRNRILVAVVVALIVAVGAVVWSASRTTGLVIQPFSVPPELVEDGLDGRAVAALFQDELVRLEAASYSARSPASFRNDWSEGITVEVEAGGLSLTDAYTALVRWLGKETYVSGGLRQTTSGLELVVRSSDGTAVSVQGPADRPEVLMRQAAERVYEQTQPYRYTVYLREIAIALPAGPERQALDGRIGTILTGMLDSPSQTERVWGYSGLTRTTDTSALDAFHLLELALEIDPEHPNILSNLVQVSGGVGHDEASMAYARRQMASMSNPRNRAKVTEARQKSYVLDFSAAMARFQGDWLKALELYTRALDGDQWNGSTYRDDWMNARIALHQPSALARFEAAEALRARGTPDPGNSVSSVRGNQLIGGNIFELRGKAAASLDQWPEVVAALEAFEVEVAPTLSPRASAARATFIWPRLAFARAWTGDLAGAQALIAATPLDCYLCVRERARIAELAGDRPSADRWSAEARRQGPSLPFAFAERGQMLMGRGDTAGAIAFYEQAVERGPRWADPQKYWGDALMAQGDEAGAIRKYRAAADRAPQWGALHLAWGRALEAQGRRDQAREKYTEAARMDLSAADRAEVVRRLGAVSGGA